MASSPRRGFAAAPPEDGLATDVAAALRRLTFSSSGGVAVDVSFRLNFQFKQLLLSGVGPRHVLCDPHTPVFSTAEAVRLICDVCSALNRPAIPDCEFGGRDDESLDPKRRVEGGEEGEGASSGLEALETRLLFDVSAQKERRRAPEEEHLPLEDRGIPAILQIRSSLAKTLAQKAISEFGTVEALLLAEEVLADALIAQYTRES